MHFFVIRKDSSYYLGPMTGPNVGMALVDLRSYVLGEFRIPITYTTFVDWEHTTLDFVVSFIWNFMSL